MSTPAPLVFGRHRFELEGVPCNFCGSTEFHPFWKKMRHGLNLPTVFCQTCGLCQSHPRPTAAALTLFYSELYNSFHHRETPIDPNGEYVQRSYRHAGARVDLLSKFLSPGESHRVVEIGAGVGQTQRVARERTKWKISGIEPGKGQFELCQRQGLEVRNAFFDDQAGLEAGAYDAVLSYHVFEHVESPRHFLARANRLLKDGALLHLEVPNLARPGDDLDSFFQFPHLYNFSALTLRNYVQAAGFRPLFLAERMHNLVLISKKVAPAVLNGPAPDDFERYDIENFMQRLRMLERVFKLAATIPDFSLLGKVKSTLMAI